MKLLVGTSGYSYRAWKGYFYPEDLPASKMLAYYAEQLPAVEINNTFYRMPKAEMLEKWRDSVPEGFRFVLKASQRITHRHRLKDAGDSVRYLVETSRALGEKRGPFLLQLPPFLKKDAERLRDFLAEWPQEARAAFEFRHESWFDDEVLGVLEDAGAALCLADTDKEERNAPIVATNPEWGYLRMRRQDYDSAALAKWAEKVAGLGWSEVYAFFKHEDEGAGPRMAAEFREAFGD